MIKLAAVSGVPVLIDPANIPDYSKYSGATALKLNRTETEKATGLPAMTSAICRRRQVAAGSIWIWRRPSSRSTKTARISLRAMANTRWLKTRQRQVYDVTGAGDMVLAMLAVARTAGATWEEAVALANVAGGLEVERFGSVPIKPREILDELLSEAHQHLGKERTLEQLASSCNIIAPPGRRSSSPTAAST